MTLAQQESGEKDKTVEGDVRGLRRDTQVCFFFHILIYFTIHLQYRPQQLPLPPYTKGILLNFNYDDDAGGGGEKGPKRCHRLGARIFLLTN